ncbi:hypothetical protein R6Q59_014103 [Mikania micrantha]
MAACCPVPSFPLTHLLLKLSHSLPNLLSLHFSYRRTSCIVASSHRTYSPAPESNRSSSFIKFLNSCVVFFTSVALSVSVFVTDVDTAGAFIVATTRKLQKDELATVRPFQENTPSVVYITNPASRCPLGTVVRSLGTVVRSLGTVVRSLGTGVRLHKAFRGAPRGVQKRRKRCSLSRGNGTQDAFTLDVLEVPQGSGSGFVWDKKGHVVTNYHVIRGASNFRVTLADQSTYDAIIVGFVQDKDVAVLCIDAPKDKLRPIPVGVSGDLLLGQKVFAIGNPASELMQHGWCSLCSLGLITDLQQVLYAPAMVAQFGLDHIFTDLQPVTVEVLPGDHVEKIPIVLQPKADET